MEPDLLGQFLDRVVTSGIVLHDPARVDGESCSSTCWCRRSSTSPSSGSTRRTIHERVAQVLDAPDRVRGVHRGRGGRPPLRGGRTAPRGARALPAGGPRAAERSGHREAIAFLHQGIALALELPDVTEGRASSKWRCSWRSGSSIATRSYADPELAAAYDRARELCELLGNDERVGQTLGGLSVYYINHGEVALGAELAERVLAIAGTHAGRTPRGAGPGPAQPRPQLQGDAEESLEQATQALAVYRPDATWCSGTGSAPTREWRPTSSPAGVTWCSAISTGVSPI